MATSWSSGGAFRDKREASACGEKRHAGHSFSVGVPFHTSSSTALGPFVKLFTTIAIVIFSLVAVLHVLRLMFRWEVVINGLVIPMWVSVVGIIVAGGLAVLVWREARQGKH